MPLLKHALERSLRKKEHIVPISVRVRKRKVLNTPIIKYFEREILGLASPVVQRAAYYPLKKKAKISIVSKNGNTNIGNIEATIHSKNKSAQISDVSLQKEYQNTGLFSQMLSDMLKILKKVGVKEVRAIVLRGQRTYAMLGFEVEAGEETHTIMTKYF